MMKRILFLLAGTFIFALNSYSQCTPDTSITHNVPGIYPDSATGLPHAYVGMDYTTVIQVKVPVDTTYLGFPATIDSINATNVTGLPAGFTYLCYPSSCSFPGGSNACILIQGPAPLNNMIGTYPIVVELTVYGKVLGTPQQIPATNDNYAIVIESTAGLWSLSNGSFAVKQNAPNPFLRYTIIPVNSRVNGKVNLKVSDLLGNIVLQQDREVQRGINNLTLDAAHFEGGIYLYTVSDGKNSVTRRMVVSGKNEF